MASETGNERLPGKLPVHLGLVARVRQSLFPAGTKALTLPSARSLGGISFNASIAEFLLIIRLRARSQHKVQSAEILERAAHIVLVTCKNWFTAGNAKSPGDRKPL